MSQDRRACYERYHQSTSRNVLAALRATVEPDVEELVVPPCPTMVTGAAGDGDSPGLSHREREERVRHFQRTQAEEAERRRDELSRQEHQVMRQLEQAEEERRRRFKELGNKDSERRAQAEERRRMLEEQESERHAAILRRNQEREAMLETKRLHQSGSIVLGFGSTAPRWESPGEMGKRWTSASQIDGAGGSPDARASEGKAAAAVTTAAAGTAPSHAEHAAVARLRGQEEASARRHRSDLTPTTPGRSFRDPPPPRRRSPAVSGAATPTTTSRPGSSLSQQSSSAAGRGAGVALRSRTAGRRPRPVSIAGIPSTRAAAAADNNKAQPEPRPQGGRGSSLNNTPRRPAPTVGGSASEPRRSAAAASPTRRTPAQVKADDARKKKQRSKSSTPQPTEATKATPTPVKTTSPPPQSESKAASVVQKPRKVSPPPEAADAGVASVAAPEATEQVAPSVDDTQDVPPKLSSTAEHAGAAAEQAPPADSPLNGTDGWPGRPQAGYTSEAAARAALAERRRAAREQAERQAEAERLQLERQQREEEERQRAEERAVQEARRAEQLRLQKAIEEAEAERAAEAERQREETEQRLRREAEEAAVREQAEQARAAAAQKAAQEEQERMRRRSRVAEIMSRTRNVNNNAEKSASPPTEAEMNAANKALSEAAEASSSQASEAGSGPASEAGAADVSLSPEVSLVSQTGSQSEQAASLAPSDEVPAPETHAAQSPLVPDTVAPEAAVEAPMTVHDANVESATETLLDLSLEASTSVAEVTKDAAQVTQPGVLLDGQPAIALGVESVSSSAESHPPAQDVETVELGVEAHADLPTAPPLEAWGEPDSISSLERPASGGDSPAVSADFSSNDNALNNDNSAVERNGNGDVNGHGSFSESPEPLTTELKNNGITLGSTSLKSSALIDVSVDDTLNSNFSVDGNGADFAPVDGNASEFRVPGAELTHPSSHMATAELLQL